MSAALSNLTLPILILIAIAILVALIYLLLQRQSGETGNGRNSKSFSLPASPLAVKPKAIMSEAERAFYHSLQNAFANQYEIFPQLELQSLVAQAGDLPPQVWGRLRNSRVDFVLAHPKYLGTIAVIELDDSSHQQATTRVNDEIQERICRDAKIPFARFRVGEKWNTEEIRARIEQAINPKKDGIAPNSP